MKVDRFWSHYEVTVENFAELLSNIQLISDAAAKNDRSLVWRGQADSSWALHSKLYRMYLRQKPTRTQESQFAKLEKEILVELRQWGLHSQRNVGRLSVLSQIAMMQHFGAPTRFLDITFNALVGAFFAVEEGDHNAADGRLFALDISGRLINDRRYLRHWEDALDTPWSESAIKRDFQNSINNGDDQVSDFIADWLKEWTSHFYAWKPPALDSRISAQHGGFLLGGILGTNLREGFIDRDYEKNSSIFQLKDPRYDNRKLAVAEARELTCLAITPNAFPAHSMRANTKNSVYCIKISSNAKSSIRRSLKNVYGYTHSFIYPDFSGFASYGVKKIIS